MYERSWMDLTFFHFYLLKKLYCLFKKTENKWKRGRGWPILKIVVGDMHIAGGSILNPSIVAFQLMQIYCSIK